MLLIELCEKYCAENPQIKSNETVRLLKSSVRQYVIYLNGPGILEDFTARNITDYIRHRRQAGKAESTIERESAKLMTLWRWAANEGMIQAPKIRIEKAQVDTPICFLRHELRRLFREVRAYDRPIGGVSGDVFLMALLSTIWDTAERIGAMRAIDRKDFDVLGRSWWWPRTGWVTIRHRKRHGKTMVRPLRRSTTAHVRRLLEATDAKVPFAIVDRTTLYGHLDRVLERAGLPVDRKHKFHCIRRSHASYLKRAGGDAQDSLGQVDPTSIRRYLDPRVTNRWQHIDWLFNPLGLWDRLLAMFGVL